MLKILNKTRKVSGKMSVPKQIMTTFFALLFGGGMGIVAKFLDLNRLPSFLDWLDLSNFLGRTAPWIFIAVCLAVFSKSPLKAGINVLRFCGNVNRVLCVDKCFCRLLPRYSVPYEVADSCCCIAVFGISDLVCKGTGCACNRNFFRTHSNILLLCI